jgi:hypothetical protein
VADQDGEERFTESDLEPSAEEVWARRRGFIDRIAAAVAALCAGTMFGGLIALGACAAPMVFTLTPPPWNGNAMGAAFARWDRVAVVAGALLLACEMVRTWASRGRSRDLVPRIRRAAAILVALSAVYIGATLSPRINQLHLEGVRRGEGPQGAELEEIHKRAELVGKIESALALGLVILHVLTIRSRDDEDDEDGDAQAPLPPGPR